MEPVDIYTELNHKVINTLTEAVNQCNEGELSEHELFLVRRTLFEATGGLIDPEIKELTYADDPGRGEDLFMYLHADGRIVVVHAPAGADHIKVIQGQSGFHTRILCKGKRPKALQSLQGELHKAGFSPVAI